MRQLRIGLIGVGNMGRNHLRILAEESGYFSLAGIYDADLTRAQNLAEQYRTEAFPNAEELLNQVDAGVCHA